MHAAIALTYLVAARIEPRPWPRPLPPRRRRARAALGSLLVAIGRALWRAGRRLASMASGSPGGAVADRP